MVKVKSAYKPSNSSGQEVKKSAKALASCCSLSAEEQVLWALSWITDKVIIIVVIIIPVSVA